MDKYYLHITEKKITAYHNKNSWRWHEIISMHSRGAIKYYYDLDSGLIIYFYKAKNEECFSYLREVLKGKVVSVIDEDSFDKLFDSCYEFEKASY